MRVGSDNGKVLIVEGTGDAAELYDPDSRTFLPAGIPLATHRQHPTATKLGDGKVLVVGGKGASTTAEIYDPSMIRSTSQGV